MTIREADIKLLWGRSGSRCSKCRCELSHVSSVDATTVPIGEQAHIVAQTEDGPRGKSPMPPEERDRYHNLILLCPTDHTLVDKAPSDFPVEVLHKLKTDHELWVQESLGGGRADAKREAAEFIYADLVDLAVSLGGLARWAEWTSWALAPDPRLPIDQPDKAHSLVERVLAAPWPGRQPELERALQTFARALHDGCCLFLDHAEKEGDYWVGKRFYKDVRGWDEDLYNEKFASWEEWTEGYTELFMTATKAANWLGDVAREVLNPMFFVREGRFLVRNGPLMDLSWETLLLQFSAAERDSMPMALVARAATLRKRPGLPS